MKKIVLLLSMLSVVSVASAAYVETFNSDNAGFRAGYGVNDNTGVPATWVSTGGNPGGHISASLANLWANWTYTTTPYGDMTGLTMTIDTMVTDGATGQAQFYVGRGGTYYIDGAWDVSLDTNWTTHQSALNTTNFALWSGSSTLAYVLAAPDDIGIWFSGGLAGGAGTLNVDNFGTVPEPLTLALLGLGALALRRKKA